MNNSKIHITAKGAIDILLQDLPLVGYRISGSMNLYEFKNPFKSVVYIENCIIENFASISVEFSNRVTIINCRFYNCCFNAAYFLSGLYIDKCQFEKYLDFDAGGHNEKGKLFSITNSDFKGFVNFFDCWFKGDVVIKNNNFQKGTNLMGNLQMPFQVSFDIPPIVEKNVGQLNLNGEGDKGNNSIELFQP